MRWRAIYREKDSWVLCQCLGCGRLNYVEPHGTTAECRSRKCNPNPMPKAYTDIYGKTYTHTVHRSIPQAFYNFDRTHCVRKPPHASAP